MKIKMTNDNFTNDYQIDVFDQKEILILKNINDNINIIGNQKIFTTETNVDTENVLLTIDNRFNTKITISRDYATALIDSVLIYYND